MNQKPVSTPEGCTLDKKLDTGETVTFMAKDIRRERTGVHAMVGIHFRDKLLDHDTFNVGRSRDRGSLARSAWDGLALAGEVTQTVYPKEVFRHDLDMFCFYIAEEWEQDMMSIETYDLEETPPPVSFCLEPYIVEHGGTILFAPGGSGKSMLALAWAIIIANDLADIWSVVPREVVYVNLERPPHSLQRREHYLARAVGVAASRSNVSFLHMRGHSLNPVLNKLRPFVKEHPNCLVVLDSISRTGVGSLIDDQVANKFIDMMGSLNTTWLGIGHTPRADSSHVFGSSMYDNGADLVLKLSSEEQDSTLGLAIEAIKANDVAKAKRALYAFDFNGHGQVESLRPATEQEFPELAFDRKAGRRERIMDYLRLAVRTSVKDIAENTGIDPGDVSKAISTHPDDFVKIGSGKGLEVGLRARENIVGG